MKYSNSGTNLYYANLARAHYFAKISHLSYDNLKRKNIRKSVGLRGVKLISNDFLTCFVAHNNNEIIVVFRICILCYNVFNVLLCHVYS